MLSTAFVMFPSCSCNAWMQASLSVKPMFCMACNWPLYRTSGLSCSAARKRLNDVLKSAAGLFALRPLNTAGESCGGGSSADAFDVAFLLLAAALSPAPPGSPVIDNFATASCKEAIDWMVCAWKICPMKPESRNGSSGCGFTVGPGIVWTNWDNKCCMFWSCIIAAMALVSKVPSHSGGGTPSSTSSFAATSASFSSSSSSSSSFSPNTSFAAAMSLAFLLCFGACDFANSSSCIGLLTSCTIDLRTSNEPPGNSSRAVMARSVLLSTSRTCTGFRKASVDCLMKSTSCNMLANSGLLSSIFANLGSIFKRLRMKSWSLSKLCIAGDSSICCRISGFCSTCLWSAPNWGGIEVMSRPSGASPPAVVPCSKWIVLFRSIP
mmetsp:Transcript_56578/g.143157  ORF Transcript_56578/g.143157 Transcript_56578/m.143157 type:complete len:380 (+) Transcript_56578:86-1225(+)